MKEIQAVIFDLGAVLLDTDESLIPEAFRAAGVPPTAALVEEFRETGFLDQLERGEVTPAAFRDKVRNRSGLPLPDDVIDRAWNSMLLAFPGERLSMLRELKSHYRLFLLSNTNAIHYEGVKQILRRDHSMKGFENIFEKEYYSHLLGLRKPDPAIFHRVISENNLNPSRTLFIDDNILNVEAGLKAGLVAVRHAENEDIVMTVKTLDLFG